MKTDEKCKLVFRSAMPHALQSWKQAIKLRAEKNLRKLSNTYNNNNTDMFNVATLERESWS